MISGKYISVYGNIIIDKNIIIYSHRLNTLNTQYNQELICAENINNKILNNPNIILNYNYNSINHNLSIYKNICEYVAIGGASMPSYITGGTPANYANIGYYNDGLYLLTSKNLINWSKPKLIIDRDWGFKNECCSFDSQSSLLYNNEKYYLYCRWNPSRGKRKLQVFISNDIDNWSNNYKEVLLDKNINIYTSHMFKYHEKVLGIIRYYEDNISGTDSKEIKDSCKIGLISSNDGINFIFEKNIINNYNIYKDGDITQGHLIENNTISIYLLTFDGKLKKISFTYQMQ